MVEDNEFIMITILKTNRSTSILIMNSVHMRNFNSNQYTYSTTRDINKIKRTLKRYMLVA